MIIGSLTTGADVKTVINLTYLPEYIAWVAASALTALKIEVLGIGTIVDLDRAGLQQLGRAGLTDKVTNGFLLPLADGIIKNKNVVITFTNSDDQTPNIYGYSDSEGSVIFQSTQQTVFAKSGIDFPGDSFMFMGFDNGSAANDELNITFEDGTVQKFNLEELKFRNGIEFGLNNTNDDFYLLNEGQIEMVNYIPESETVLYLVEPISS